MKSKLKEIAMLMGIAATLNEEVKEGLPEGESLIPKKEKVEKTQYYNTKSLLTPKQKVKRRRNKAAKKARRKNRKS